jgi:transposase
MPRLLPVAAHLPIADLERRYRACRDPVERSRWQMVWLVAAGHRVPEVAALMGYTANWVREIIRRYNTDGPRGIADRRHANPGQPPLLTPALREALRQALTEPPADGGLWTSRKVAAWMAARLDRPVGEVRGWEALRSLGFTPQRPRPRATAADAAAQEQFKKGAR